MASINDSLVCELWYNPNVRDAYTISVFNMNNGVVYHKNVRTPIINGLSIRSSANLRNHCVDSIMNGNQIGWRSRGGDIKYAESRGGYVIIKSLPPALEEITNYRLVYFADYINRNDARGIEGVIPAVGLWMGVGQPVDPTIFDQDLCKKIWVTADGRVWYRPDGQVWVTKCVNAADSNTKVWYKPDGRYWITDDRRIWIKRI